MYDFQVFTANDTEAQRVSTAFYRFLELRSPQPEATATMRAEILSDGVQVQIGLWSPQAVHDFERYLATFKLHRPQPSRSFRRFDESEARASA